MYEEDHTLGHGGIFQLPEDTEPVPGWALDVSPDMVGLRVDAFICARIPRLSRSRASRLRVIDRTTQKRLKKSATVVLGQQILAIRPIPDQHPDPNWVPTIIWEDDSWCVLNKPPTLATHPSASYFRRTVSYWLRTQGYRHMQSVHRLDVETSGILVCGKSPQAVKTGSDAFAEQEVDKRYLALVEGVVDKDEWVAEMPLGFDPTSRVPIKMGVGSLSALTRFNVRARGKQRTLVEARPIGGRQHQIRVHASLSGHPLVGDKLYGPSESFFLNRTADLSSEDLLSLGHWRHALHAYRVSAEFLPHSLEILPPEDWSNIRGIPDVLLNG